ncbi:DegV family protein with EDD domain [Sinobacterium caligoides]|uniref:DegV family protein with EDD domain n=1 Tax=Sinobacterium caligoides TaxID=933926 RepID=A0A3N2DN18_9GAMM|nr:DegV family protein [Sinobacterium caligoides]ROS01207.1 DegV family protein with EDD domain [Sinobacterium caligoides]
MSAVLVVDAGCDLPKSYLDENNIQVLPITVLIDGKEFVDNKDPEVLKNFFSEKLTSRDRKGYSVAWDSDEMSQFVLEKLVPKHDFALVETITKSRSPLFDNAREASFKVLGAYKNHQPDRRIPSFAMRVINTGTLFAGQGLLAVKTNQLIKSGVTKCELRRSVDKFKEQVYSYAVPPDVAYLRSRIKLRGDTSISWAAATIGKALHVTPILCGREDDTFPVAKVRGHAKAINLMFDVACKRIREDSLTMNTVVLSIADEIEKLEQFEGYARLKSCCEQHDVELITCMMGLTGCVNLGPGTISISVACEKAPHEE